MVCARRWLLPFAALLVGMAALGPWTLHQMGSAPPTQLSPPVPSTATVNDDAGQRFAAFVSRFKSEAAGSGLSPADVARELDGLAHDPEVLELAGAQPEYVKTAGEYVGLLASEARLEIGRQKLTEFGTLLSSIEQTYGVDRHIVLAIWGIESNFGAAMGTRAVLRSLATLAALDSRRRELWRTELAAALRILQSGDATADMLFGSWAGAMGHTQFMPSTFASHAVDFDRDGRRDIWGTVGDALASTANYLRGSGWSREEPWAFEVVLPQGFDHGLSTPGVTNSWADWQALGLAAAAGRQFPGRLGNLQLLLPAGAKGPAFLAGDNFRALLRYNNSTNYALAVGTIAQTLAGGGRLSRPWPTGERALGRAEREEMQRRLEALGFDAGGVDGVIGNGTRAAIRLFQKTRGLAADGHADLALLERLRQEGRR